MAVKPYTYTTPAQCLIHLFLLFILMDFLHERRPPLTFFADLFQAKTNGDNRHRFSIGWKIFLMPNQRQNTER